MSEALFSVCIPVLNGERSLPALFAALRSQTEAPREIIVSDGGSSDGTRELVAHQDGVILLSNPAVHAAGGRNVAIAAARGTWCAFTDADCVPDPGWLSSLRGTIERFPYVVGLGGRVLPLPERSLVEEVSAEVLLERVMQFDDQPAVLGQDGIRRAPMTANAAYRRDVLVRLGGFDTVFENYAEDFDLFLRLVKANLGTVRYVPTALVHAEHPATVPALVRKWRQYGMASSFLQRYHFGRFHLDRRLYASLGRSLLDSLTGPPGRRARARLEALQLLSHLSGKWEGSLRLGVVNL